MKNGKLFWRDLSIVLRMIWLNLVLFVCLLAGGAILLKISGAYPHAGWFGLFLDSFHMALLERVAEDSDGWIPILLSFVMPLASVLVLGEGVLKVISIYLQKREHREEWDTMVVQTFSNHIVVCGVGELGKALVKRIRADYPESRMVLVDLRPGLLTEIGLFGDNIACIQDDITNIETLKKANCHKAKLVLFTSGNDASNLEAAYKIIQLNSEGEIWVRLHQNGLVGLLDLSRKPNVHFFSPYQQAADAIAAHLLHQEKVHE
ncbi:MAG: NAD-binding protein [Chloroflexi bacterium]|nr:NAD-binding protein [Chloroflexota bacterium]